MKLKLEALSPAEGIGIVRQSDGTLRLIRPPYRSSDTPSLPEAALQETIIYHGFSAASKVFDDWRDVIQFLNQVVADTRHLVGVEIPEAIEATDVLALAPCDVISSYLGRVEQELIPHKLFDRAELILSTLLRIALSRNELKVAARAADLLELNRTSRKERQAGMAELARLDARFAHLSGQRAGQAAEADRIAEAMRNRGSVLAFAPAS